MVEEVEEVVSDRRMPERSFGELDEDKMSVRMGHVSTRSANPAF